jgi:hypothetical protein
MDRRKPENSPLDSSWCVITPPRRVPALERSFARCPSPAPNSHGKLPSRAPAFRCRWGRSCCRSAGRCRRHRIVSFQQPPHDAEIGRQLLRQPFENGPEACPRYLFCGLLRYSKSPGSLLFSSQISSKRVHSGCKCISQDWDHGLLKTLGSSVVISRDMVFGPVRR